jgi:DNA-binding transcriptional LysR family regulator
MTATNRMSIKRMLILVEVARSGSLSGAARTLHYTPSAISQQIVQLQGESGHALIQRTARGVHLTDAGRIVVRHAERIERMQEAAHRELEDLGALKTGTLRLGTFGSLTQSLLPDILSEFRSRAPAVEVSLASSTRDDLRLRLQSGEIELAFLWDYPYDPLIPVADEEITFLAHDPCVLLVPAGHRLASEREAKVSTLLEEKWIARGTAADRDLLARLGVRAARTVFEGQSYEEMQAVVEAGIGIALMPESATVNLRPGVSLLQASGGPVRRFWFALRRQSRMSPAASVMNSLLRSKAETGRSSASVMPVPLPRLI